MRLIQINDGLGDHIALAGACLFLARRDGGLIVACRPRYVESVHALFNDQAGIVIAPRGALQLRTFHKHTRGRYSDDVAEMVMPYLRAEQAKTYNTSSPIHHMLFNVRTLNTPPWIDVDHYKHIYRDYLHMDYEERWRSSPLPGNPNCVQHQYDPPAQPYAFLHDDPTRLFFIDRNYVAPGLEIIQPMTTLDSNVLQYCKLIENATEVHCMDSSFFHLTEQLQPKGKLYFHRYARPYTPIWMDYATKHAWTVLSGRADSRA